MSKRGEEKGEEIEEYGERGEKSWRGKGGREG